ncbi:MAG: tyrosine-type recombinase/integrase [Lachnospiraceae bacterium]|nr:tyrosine-type recombinase/integrase [Lachnospiraceae bacterium]
MTLEVVYSKFIRAKKLSGLSKKTISDYESFIGQFLKFIGYDVDVFVLQQEDIEQYIEFQVDRNISRNTFSTYVRHLKIFIRWICNNYDVHFTYKTIKVPKVSKKVVKVYSDLEIKQIFNSIQYQESWIEYRNKSIISFMLDSGVRQGEVCSLMDDNIFCDLGRMVVRGKGNKERIVPLGKQSILFYNEYRGLCPYKSYMAFVTKTGEPISNNTVKLMVTKLGKKLPFEISSHKLRHNFATNYCLDMYWKNGSIDIYRLMTILGHEDISTTRRYLHIANEIIASSECLSHLDKVFNC